jgi:Ca2+-binding RTX toxin-like protein
VTGAGTYKVAVTYTDAQGFTATLDSPEQVVRKPISQQVDIAPSQRGSRFRVQDAAASEVIVNLKGSSDLIEIDAEVSAILNAVTTENWGTGYVAWNVGSTLQAGTGERVSLNGLGKYSFVATAINAATSTIVLEQGKNSAFFLHDAYSAFYEGLTLSTDGTGRQSTARILDFDVIKMGSAGGNSIVDLTSKDYITGAVTVHGADKGRSIFWGTDSDDTYLSGGGDSVIFGGGGFNQLILGARKDVLQFRSTVDSANLIRGFDPTKDVLELWRGRTETVEAPTFITEEKSTTMTWGGNTVQFEGLTGITAESLMISTQFAA